MFTIILLIVLVDSAYCIRVLRMVGSHLLVVGFLLAIDMFLLAIFCWQFVEFPLDYGRYCQVPNARCVSYMFLFVFCVIIGNEFVTFLLRRRMVDRVDYSRLCFEMCEFPSIELWLTLFFLVYVVVYMCGNCLLGWVDQRQFFTRRFFSPVFLGAGAGFIGMFAHNRCFFLRRRPCLFALELLVCTLSVFARTAFNRKSIYFIFFVSLFFPILFLLFLRLRNTMLKLCIVLLVFVAIVFCSQKRQGYSGFKRFMIYPMVVVRCLNMPDKPKYGLYWYRVTLSRCCGNCDRMSFGEWCLTVFHLNALNNKRIEEVPTVSRYSSTSWSCNFLGEVDIMAGYGGLFLVFLFGVVLALIDFWFYSHQQFGSFYILLGLKMWLESFVSSLGSLVLGNGTFLMLCFLFLKNLFDSMGRCGVKRDN